MSMSAYFRSAGTSRENVFSRFSDLVLVAGVIAIVAMMVLPLPALLIDMLVAVNIASGLVLLLVAIYIASPLEFSVFPSVLLMTTLFRLSLSIATTRMILLEGHAGHIIDTFGKVVAGGNLVVGLVVFLIITVVQFIVIAKGAERVAEVAARFSLDAMPGKQLSIDSDLRSGLIDKDEAKRRRRNLEMESKLHGSLDGAMKFVKGDTIAGIGAPGAAAPAAEARPVGAAPWLARRVALGPAAPCAAARARRALDVAAWARFWVGLARVHWLWDQTWDSPEKTARQSNRTRVQARPGSTR